MKTHVKVATVVALIAVFLFSLLLAFTFTSVKADVSPAFYMDDGASVRTTEPYGIRFGAYVSDEYYQSLESDGDFFAFGMAIVPARFAPDGLIDEKTPSVQLVDSKGFAETSDAPEGYRRYNVALVNVPQDFYEEQIAARAYVRINDEYTFTEEQQVRRDIAHVAAAALNDGETGDALDNIVNAVAKGVTIEDKGDGVALSLWDGKPLKFSAITEPAGYDVVWSANGENVTVDGDGNVTATAEGTATVTAKFGEYTDQVTVNVTKLGKTDDTAEINKEYAVPAIDGATWSVYYITYPQGVPSTYTAERVSEGVTENGFTPAKEGIYEVRYDKGGDTATLIVLAANPETIVTPSTEKMQEDPLRDHPTFALNGRKFLGEDTLRLTGDKLTNASDAGIYWNTGVYNDLNLMTIFLRNDSDGMIRLIYLNGCTVEVMPGNWAVVSMAGGQMAGNAADPNSQVARIDNEWRILLHMNVASCTRYDVTFAFTMDKGQLRAPELHLDKTSDVAEINGEYTVPVIDGATWSVYYNESEFAGIITATGFTPDKAGAYSVKYTKRQGDLQAEATFTLYAVDRSKLLDIELSSLYDDEHRIKPAREKGETYFGMQSIRFYGAKTGSDIGTIWHTGITNDVQSVTIYIYNNSDGAITYVYSGGSTLIVAPKSWGAAEIPGYWMMTEDNIKNWDGGYFPPCIGRENGEWLFSLPINVAQTTNYDISFLVAFETAEA